MGYIVNPNSLTPFFVSRLSPQKERVTKWESPPLDSNQGLLHHNAFSAYATPLGCHCPGSDFCALGAFSTLSLIGFVGLSLVRIMKMFWKSHCFILFVCLLLLLLLLLLLFLRKKIKKRELPYCAPVISYGGFSQKFQNLLFFVLLWWFALFFHSLVIVLRVPHFPS